jgi:hypothetical protein
MQALFGETTIRVLNINFKAKDRQWKGTVGSCHPSRYNNIHILFVHG